MSRGVIYILTNPSFPQFVKLGYASDLHRRLRELNRSETLPYAFRAYAVYETDHKLTDKALHELIDRLNPDLRTIETFNGKRRVKEFFEMSAEDRLHRVTPTGNEVEEERDAEQSRTRRPPFRFSMVGLRPGDVVAFAQDPDKRATVVDDSHIEHEGVTSSLSALAEQLTGAGHALQGPLYFAYEGELLTDRRDRMENGAQRK